MVTCLYSDAAHDPRQRFEIRNPDIDFSVIITMSAEGQEELLDYSDSEEIAVPSNAPEAGADGADKDADKKGSYVGIHATGFRDFLLKPELLRAIGDCGFEHPSEGSYPVSKRVEMKAAIAT